MTPEWFRGTLAVGDSGPLVALVQRKLGLVATGVYDVDVAAAVRGLQRASGLEQTGEVNEKTARRLGKAAAAHLLPEWYYRELSYGLVGDDVVEVRRRIWPGRSVSALGATHFNAGVETGVRRFQSAHGITPTGIVDERTARALGE